MNPPDHSVAWEHPPTQRAWSKQLAVNILALLGWIALWETLLATLVAFLSPGYTIVPFLIYSFYWALFRRRDCRIRPRRCDPTPLPLPRPTDRLGRRPAVRCRLGRDGRRHRARVVRQSLSSTSSSPHPIPLRRIACEAINSYARCARWERSTAHCDFTPTMSREAAGLSTPCSPFPGETSPGLRDL